MLGKQNVGLKDIEPVGQYAVRLVFDDGHDSGLYSWKYLHELGRSGTASGRGTCSGWPTRPRRADGQPSACRSRRGLQRGGL